MYLITMQGSTINIKIVKNHQKTPITMNNTNKILTTIDRIITTTGHRQINNSNLSTIKGLLNFNIKNRGNIHPRINIILNNLSRILTNNSQILVIASLRCKSLRIITGNPDIRLLLLQITITNLTSQNIKKCRPNRGQIPLIT